MKIAKLLDAIMGLISAYKAGLVQRKRQNLKSVAICVGHSRIGDKGAISVGGVTEWDYNKKVADALQTQLRHQGITSVVFDDYPSDSYSGAMNWLARGIRKEKCDLAIELHFNSYAKDSASGYEYLYFEGSKNGKRLANCFLKSHGESFTEQTSRGVKSTDTVQRGAAFLRRVPPPAVICEPFFGSSPTDWTIFEYKGLLLAGAYARAIVEYFKDE